jgi:hypothetical protein
MSDSDPQDSPAAVAARAGDLIADFQARQEAWRTQAQVLARLREETRIAAEREAADLLAKARADIKRTLVDTRRKLMMLAMQLRAVGDPPQTETPHGFTRSSTSTADWNTLPESVSQLRRDLQQVLAEAQPDLDELATLTRSFSTAAHTHEPDEGPGRNPLPYQDPETKPAFADQFPSQHSAAARLAVTYGQLIKRGVQAKRSAIVLAGLATAVSLAGWRLAVSSDGGQRRPAQMVDTVKAKPPDTASTMPPIPGTLVEPRAERSTVSAPLASDRQTWLSLLVEARRSVWIQVTTDGRTDPGRTFQAGESRRILASRSISIVVGDAGAVTLALNGGKATPPGRDGQVVTRQVTIADATRIAASQVR